MSQVSVKCGGEKELGQETKRQEVVWTELGGTGKEVAQKF